MTIGSAAKGPRGPLRGRLTVASSHIVLTEPVPELIEEIGWTGGECITDSRALVHYFRTTPDGRIAFGWGGGRIAWGARTHGRAEVDAEVVAAIRQHLLEYFPGLAGKRITHAWGGPIDASPTHLPLVLPLRRGRAFVAAGYTGNGVGPTDMVGRTLASLALDRRDEAASLAFVDPGAHRVPPEPFHWVGGEAIRLGILAKEEAEMAERVPGRLASGVATDPRADRVPHRALTEPACREQDETISARNAPARRALTPQSGERSSKKSPRRLPLQPPSRSSRRGRRRAINSAASRRTRARR